MPTAPSVQLIAGCAVEVLRPVQTGADRFGAPVVEMQAETVENVLPQPEATGDVGEGRPAGSSVSMAFHFPKGYGQSLKGCVVSYGGKSYRVVGDPKPWLEENVPGPWSMRVETEAVDG